MHGSRRSALLTAPSSAPQGGGAARPWHLQARGIAPVLDALAHAGVDPAEVVREAGVDPHACGQPERRMPASLTDRVWVAASERLGEALPLQVAASVRPSSFGHLTYLLGAAPNVRMFLRALTHRYGLLGNATAHHFDAAVSRVRVEVELRAQPRPPAVESFAVAVIACFLQRETGGRVAPRTVHLRRARPSSALDLAHRRCLGAEVRFGGEVSAIELDRAALDAPLIGGDRELFRLLEAHADALSGGDEPDAIAAVHDRVVARGVSIAVRPADVAADLGLSERTLRRRLTLAGSSFQAVLDELLRDAAERLLAEARVEDVAAALGYADAAAFRRAYRRWTGATPGRRPGVTGTPGGRG